MAFFLSRSFLASFVSVHLGFPSSSLVEIVAVHKDKDNTETYDVAFKDGFKEPKVPVQRIRSLTLKDKNNQPLKLLPGQLRSVTHSYVLIHEVKLKARVKHKYRTF